MTHWMEEMIAEATRRGEFKDLHGKGKPLPIITNDDPFAGPDQQAYRILKQAGYAPEWVELRRKIVDEINWLRANPTHPERTSRLVEANVMIDKYNRCIPTPALNLPKLPRDF